MSASARTKHAFAAGLAVVMTGGGLAAVAAPAQAETGVVNYTCSAPGQTFELPVAIDSDAPASIFVGDVVTPTFSAATALPGSLAQLAKQSLGAESFDGTVVARNAFDGVALPVNHAIPSTLLGAQTTPTNVPFTATGTAALKPGTPGDLALTAGDLDATFNFKKADGTAAGGPIGATCKAPAGQAPVIDIVQVVARTTTELTLNPANSGFGETVTATAKVTPTGGVATGDVTFVIDGVSTKVPVKDGLATLDIKQAAIGSQPVSATFTPTDAVHFQGSSATPATLKVFKAETSAKVKITGKRLRQPTATTIKVVGINKTAPSGKVKLVLRKVGNKGFAKAKSGALAKGSRGFNLGRLGTGRYKIVVKYLGDSSHQDAKTIKRFRVRR